MLSLYNTFSTHSLRSQVSTEEGRCGPPQTPAPALPEETNNPPDVVPHPIYDDLNTLSRKVPFELTLQRGWIYSGYVYKCFHTQKEEPETEPQPQPTLPVYHVLEGPTPVESAPDTQKEVHSHVWHFHCASVFCCHLACTELALHTSHSHIVELQTLRCSIISRPFMSVQQYVKISEKECVEGVSNSHCL